MAFPVLSCECTARSYLVQNHKDKQSRGDITHVETVTKENLFVRGKAGSPDSFSVGVGARS